MLFFSIIATFTATIPCITTSSPVSSFASRIAASFRQLHHQAPPQIRYLKYVCSYKPWILVLSLRKRSCECPFFTARYICLYSHTPSPPGTFLYFWPTWLAWCPRCPSRTHRPSVRSRWGCRPIRRRCRMFCDPTLPVRRTIGNFRAVLRFPGWWIWIDPVVELFPIPFVPKG